MSAATPSPGRTAAESRVKPAVEIKRWRIAPVLDTSDPHVASYPIRHAPQGYVEGTGWAGVGDGSGGILSFAEPSEAQAWIAERKRLSLTAES